MSDDKQLTSDKLQRQRQRRHRHRRDIVVVFGVDDNLAASLQVARPDADAAQWNSIKSG